MSYKKRAIAAVLSAALMLTALTGCGSTASADSGDDGKVKIQYWHINSENQGGATVQEFIDEFNASQDKIEVEGRFNNGYDELLKNLQADTAAGNAPSIVQVSWSNIEYFPANFSYISPEEVISNYFPEDETFLTDTFDESILNLARNSEGTLAGVPYSISNPVLFYNADLLREAGLSEDGPQNWDEFVSFAMLSRDEDGNLMLDHSAIASYVGQLASKYDTVGIERSFSTYDNREVTVSGGTYGWLIDQPKEADALYQAIMDKKTQVREPVYAQEAASRDTNDIGYSYVEVNLTDRRLVLYKSGNPVVDTGIAISSSTPDGVYSIEEKKNQQAVGNMTVDCWMSFTDDLGIYGDPGFEPGTATESEADSFGSSSETDFSSDMTDWSSTEGCIVLSEEAARELYQNVETGMPVVIYK